MSTVWAGAAPKRKRGLRILPKDQGYFVHVTSRTVGQAFLFGDQEKRMFVSMMRQWAAFSGLGILTHCLMDNHFHIMLWVPSGMKLDHTGILNRLEEIWPDEKVMAWEAFYLKQDLKKREAMDLAVIERMGNLPEYMRVLKQSFTLWYNRKEDRKGTLWDSRYRSVVVEESPLALMSVAAYIDLNPFRAGLVNDPMSYAWSGYGASIAGDQKARLGLDALVRLSRGHQPYAAKNTRTMQLSKSKPWKEIAPSLEKERLKRAVPKKWKDIQSSYRIWLVTKGESKSHLHTASKKFSDRKGMDPIQVIEEYESLGFVPLTDRLKYRIRSFTRGVAIGGPDYLDELMKGYRSCFGPDRKIAGKKVKDLDPRILSMRQAD